MDKLDKDDLKRILRTLEYHYGKNLRLADPKTDVVVNITSVLRDVIDEIKITYPLNKKNIKKR